MVLLGNILYLKDHQHNPVLYSGWVFIGMAYMTLAWEGSVSWVHYVRKKIPPTPGTPSGG